MRRRRRKSHFIVNQMSYDLKICSWLSVLSMLNSYIYVIMSFFYCKCVTGFTNLLYPRPVHLALVLFNYF